MTPSFGDINFISETVRCSLTGLWFRTGTIVCAFWSC